MKARASSKRARKKLARRGGRELSICSSGKCVAINHAHATINSGKDLSLCESERRILNWQSFSPGVSKALRFLAPILPR